jgi:hypothetical protein
MALRVRIARQQRRNTQQQECRADQLDHRASNPFSNVTRGL